MTKRLTDPRVILGLLFAPFAVLALLWVVYLAQKATRFDPAYFSEEYQQRYATPGGVIADLEAAINRGDGQLMAALQGTRAVPTQLQPLPNVRFSIFWSKEGKYLDYLFADTVNFRRYMEHFTQVDGRYVVVPEGIFYYFDSGRWFSVTYTYGLIWWSAVIVLVAGAWLFQTFARIRGEMFKPKDRQGLRDD